MLLSQTPVVGVPTSIGPTSSINLQRPTFSWNSVAGSPTYELTVTDLTTNQAKVFNVANLTGTSWTANAPLTAGHNYRWWVRAHNGTAGAWSTAKNFTISLTAPTIQNLGTVSTPKPSLSGVLLRGRKATPCR